MKVRVLLEPVMADRAYMAGEELDLPENDATMLARWGIVEILPDSPVAAAKETEPEPATKAAKAKVTAAKVTEPEPEPDTEA